MKYQYGASVCCLRLRTPSCPLQHSLMSVLSRPPPGGGPLQFDERSRNPPATRNTPPVAGAIAWSRALFAPLRRTYARFSSPDDDMLKVEGGQRVGRRYQARASAP